MATIWLNRPSRANSVKMCMKMFQYLVNYPKVANCSQMPNIANKGLKNALNITKHILKPSISIINNNFASLWHALLSPGQLEEWTLWRLRRRRGRPGWCPSLTSPPTPWPPGGDNTSGTAYILTVIHAIWKIRHTVVNEHKSLVLHKSIPNVSKSDCFVQVLMLQYVGGQQ